MSVDHGGADVFVAEEFLDGANIVSGFEQVSSEAVTKGVATGGFCEVGSADGKFDGVLKVFLGDVMAPSLAAAWIDGQAWGGKYVLPSPGARSIDVFALERAWEINGAVAAGEVLPVQFANAGQVLLQRTFESSGQQGSAWTHAFAFADGDAVVGKVYVFNAQAKGLEQTQTATVKEVRHETVVAAEAGEDGARFATGEDNRQSSGAADAFDAGDEGKFAIEDLLVKEEEGVESLVLSGGGDVAVEIKVGKEGGDFFFAHFGGMAFALEEDEAADPVDVSAFGAKAITFDAEVPADAIEKFRRRCVGI